MQSVDPAVADATLHAGAGNYLSEDDVTSMKIEKLADGREAYVYEVYAPYAQHGGHILASFTVKVGPRSHCLHPPHWLVIDAKDLDDWACEEIDLEVSRQAKCLWSRGFWWLALAERQGGIL